jgi:hypothetical protein
MGEPSSSTATGLVALAIAMFGGSAAAGEFGAVVFGALAGSMWAMKAGEPKGRMGSAWLVLKLVMTALVMTWMVAWWLREEYALPPTETLGVVAFCLAAVGDKWHSLGGVIFNTFRDLFARFAKGREPPTRDGQP